MKITFLSHSLGEKTPLYQGRKGVEIRPEGRISDGHSCNSLHVSFPNHSSTHIDAPLHFIPGGRSITDFPADFWSFEKTAIWDCAVGPGTLITPVLLRLDSIVDLEKVELLLIKTGYERFRAEESYWLASPGLSSSLAVELKRRMPSLRAVGVDFLSISSLLHREEGRAAHREFLSREVILIEDMKLSAIKTAPSRVIVAPLLLEGADGAPATVMAFE